VRHRLGAGGQPAPTWRARRPRTRRPGAHNCLFYPRGADQPAGPSNAAANGRTPDRGYRRQLAANNSEALRDAALAGLGIALLPDFSAQAALASGQLVQVLAGWRSRAHSPMRST
jgi:DNA-binding transcriptional LysR family regulator